MSSYSLTPDAPIDTRFTAFLQSFELWNIFSQHSEDSILQAIFDRIGTENRWCVEAGAADGVFFSNTRGLIDDGWNAILVEPDEGDFNRLKEQFAGDPRIRLHQGFLVARPENGLEIRIDDLLERYGAPRDLDLLVIDVDSADYYLLNSVIRFQPRIVIVEYDPDADPMFIPQLRGPGQAGHLALRYVAEARGYDVICRTPTNLICVRKDLSHLLMEPAKPGADGYPAIGDQPRRRLAEATLAHNGRQLGQAAECVLGVGDGGGSLFVRGDYESVKAAQRIILERDRLLAQLAPARRNGSLATKAPALAIEDGRAGYPDAQRRIRYQVFAAGRWQDYYDGCSIDALPEEKEAAEAGKLPVRSFNATIVKTRIVACMSVPRIGFLDTMQSVCDTLRELGTPLQMGFGVYWHAGLTRCFESALEWGDAEGNEADFIMSVDYDSIFIPENVKEMVRLMYLHPEVDIIVPSQAKRANGGLLAGGTFDPSRDLVPIETGHFGLTLFRRGIFAKLRKPWFEERADERGGWGEGRIDADISLWSRVKEAGLQVYLAPRVICGHAEEVVAWPKLVDGKYVSVYQPATEWQATRTPPVALLSGDAPVGSADD